MLLKVTWSLCSGFVQALSGLLGLPSLAKAALPAGLPGARAGTRTVNLGCVCPLQLIQGSVNPGADCGTVALWAVSG